MNNKKLFVMPELDMCEYEVEEIMGTTSPDEEPDVNSEIEDGGEDYM